MGRRERDRGVVRRKGERERDQRERRGGRCMTLNKELEIEKEQIC